jgi:hypothetical protein
MKWLEISAHRVLEVERHISKAWPAGTAFICRRSERSVISERQDLDHEATIPKGGSDVFDLAWLDQEELEALLRAMLANSDNEICGIGCGPWMSRPPFALENFGSCPVPRPETQTSNNIR